MTSDTPSQAATVAARYGTVALLYAKNDGVRLQYELRTPCTTFGRSIDMNIRFSAPGISRHHCSLVVSPDDGSAVLCVRGANGLFLDDKLILPAPSTAVEETAESGGGGGGDNDNDDEEAVLREETRVPLPDGAVINIQGRRFRFRAPDLETLAKPMEDPETPMAVRQRPIRLSLIEAACIDSPGISTMSPLRGLLSSARKSLSTLASWATASSSQPEPESTSGGGDGDNDDDEPDAIVEEELSPSAVPLPETPAGAWNVYVSVY